MQRTARGNLLEVGEEVQPEASLTKHGKIVVYEARSWPEKCSRKFRSDLMAKSSMMKSDFPAIVFQVIIQIEFF
jgi:hypothetical protein